MPEKRKIRRALLSVYDKTGLVDFARALVDEFGIELISTGGTAKVLQEAGIPVTLVEQITGFPEMLDGRVKTLHPRIHAAILADRDNPAHMRQLAEQGIEPIDLVVVNLYPFEQTIAKPGCTFEQAIEMIDIGGPCLLRAAAKNHKHVVPICQLRSFELVLQQLRDERDVLDSTRACLASIVFESTADYDAEIDPVMGARWLALREGMYASHFEEKLRRNAREHPVQYLRLMPAAQTRYGENPHQEATVSSLEAESNKRSLVGVQLRGQGELSFNNYLDAHAALELCAELTRAARDRSAKLRFARTGEDDTAADRSAKLRFARTSRPGGTEVRFVPVMDELTTRRNLPHWQIAGATYWITFSSRIGTLSPHERNIVMNALRFWDRRRLDLHAAVVMPDHVHAILTPREVAGRSGERENLSALLQSIKAFSAREISQQRGHGGAVWVHESYDHWIRDEFDLRQKWEYLTYNIVKENLARTPDEYAWWYSLDLFRLGIGVPVTSETPLPPVLATGQRAGPDRPVGKEAEERHTAKNKAELCSTESPDRTCKAELCTTIPAVCFIKHTNACGAAVHVDPVEAYRRAYLGDPNAAMGGILAVNFPVDAAFAEVVLETYARYGKPLKDAGAAFAPGGFFVEVWLAPSFADEAVRIIRGEVEGRPRKDWGKRVRLLAVGDLAGEPDPAEMDYKRIAGGMLVQTRDLVGLNEAQWRVVTKRAPTAAEMDDLRLAWLVCKHTKSNAITICRDGRLLGNGAGQMSRVMSCRIATWLARENGHTDLLKGAVAASDAFFPFRDGPDILMEAGVTALIQPGGSKRDEDTIKACDEHDVAMIFTGTRHFRH